MAIKKRSAPPPQTAATRWAEFDGYNKQVESTATIDCSALDLERLIRKAVNNDADEILVRIAQYNPNLEPANFQAIVRFSNRNRAWATVVHRDAFQALAQAIMQASKMKPEITTKQDTNVRPDKSAGVLHDSASGRKQKPAAATGKKPVGKIRIVRQK